MFFLRVLFILLTSLGAVHAEAAEADLLHSQEVEEELEKNSETSLKAILSEFRRKGGTILRIDPTSRVSVPFELLPGDAVYPVCSGGFCRSQTLWAILSPYRDRIALFPPHAARYGYDPYNEKINWHRNDEKETWYDEFELWAGYPKQVRAGYEEFTSWHPRTCVTEQELNQIKEYYNVRYFQPLKEGQRRVYLTFDKNTHVVLKRLNEANNNLNEVYVIHLPLKDLVTSPPLDWQTFPRSQVSYQKYAEIICGALKFDTL